MRTGVLIPTARSAAPESAAPDSGAPDSAVPAGPGRVAAIGVWRLTCVAACAAMVVLPLLRPAGPGNSAVADLGLLAAMCATALWAATRAQRIQLPYWFPVGLTVLAGALAILANGGGPHAGHSLLDLAQDVFVF